MSKKWTEVGNNSIEQYSFISNPVEKLKKKREIEKNSFKWGMKIDRMKIFKPKKNKKEETDENQD